MARRAGTIELLRQYDEEIETLQRKIASARQNANTIDTRGTVELINRQSIPNSGTTDRTENEQPVGPRGENTYGARRRVVSQGVNTTTANIDLADENRHQDRRSINQSPPLMLFRDPDEEMSVHAIGGYGAYGEDERDVSEEGSIDERESRADSRCVLRKSTKVYSRKTRRADDESRDWEEPVNSNRHGQPDARSQKQLHTRVPQHRDQPIHSNTRHFGDGRVQRHEGQYATGSSPTRLIRKTEDRLQSLLENLAVQPRKSYFVKPPKFDGKGCIESHLMQFKIAASRNGWSNEEKANFLKISLTGDASTVLKDVAEDVTYEELIFKLKQCYGSLDQVEAYRVQLKARRRKRGESLSDLMKDVRRLFLLAYPGKSNYMSDIAAKDAFVDALDDRELMIRVMEREPKTLEEAFKIAERMELYSRRVDNSDRSDMESKQRNNSNKVRAATVVEDKNFKMLMENQTAMQQQIASIIQTMQQQSQQQQQAQEYRQPVRASSQRAFNCYNCGQEGHISSRCPDRNNERNY